MGRSGASRVLALTAAIVIIAVVMPLTGAGAAPMTIDFEVTPGVYTSLGGVTFPRAIDVFNCTAAPCSPAHSGTRAARGEFFGEFEREPFEARFSTPMAHVQLYVKDDSGAASTAEIEATLRAYNDPVSGSQIDIDTKLFQAGSGWNLLQVGDAAGAAQIDRVVLTGGQTAFVSDTNFLAVDDLTFDPGASPSPTPSVTPDTQPPVVTIFTPTDLETITEQNVEASFQVTEDVHLDTVVGQVVDVGPPAVVATADFCGSSFSGGCPVGPPFPIEFSRTQSISLPGATSGTYRLDIDACDLAGNCGGDSVTFALDFEPPAVVPVIPARMEVNQGVQSRLHQLHGPGTGESLNTGVTLVQEKDTLVRFYLFGDGAISEDFVGRLTVDLEMRDGSRRGLVVRPNAGAASVDAPADPGTGAPRQMALAAMRADPTTTLNFVIPGERLTNVRRMDLRLKKGSRSLTGFVQYTFGPPLRLGLNVVRLVATWFDPGTPADPLEDKVIPYLENAFPVSEVRVVSTRSLFLGDDFIVHPAAGDCGFALWQLWSVYGTDDAPVRRFTTDPSVLPTLGIVPFGALDDAAGCAYISGGLHTSSDDFERVGGTAVTETWGDVTSQEIAHSLGLIHASNNHGETGGGDAERWSYDHGTIGDRNFGAVMTEVTPPSSTDPAGQWSLFIVDPCPTTDIAERYPECTIDEGAGHNTVHDFMSYGSSSAEIDSYKTSKGRWVSDVTYNRIRAAIELDLAPGPFDEFSFRGAAAARSDPSAGLGRVDALLIDGFVHDDGTVTMLPVIRKPMPSAITRGIDSGSYTIRLVGEDGVLFRRSFEPLEISTHDSHIHSIQQVVPYREGVQRIVLLKDGMQIAEQTASPNAPTVEVTSPAGGATFDDGMVTVQWDQSDADGDPLYALVQYSPDGGWSWQGVGLVPPGGATQATFPVDEMIPGNHAFVRVVASDGLNTTVDTSDAFFSVGTTEAPGSDVGTAEVSLRLRKHLRARGRVSLVEGPHSCVELARVVIKRNGKRIRATTTSITGRFRVRLPDRAGRYQAVLKPSERGLIACEKDRSATVRHRHR